jgi:hypothetical protein
MSQDEDLNDDALNGDIENDDGEMLESHADDQHDDDGLEDASFADDAPTGDDADDTEEGNEQGKQRNPLRGVVKSLEREKKRLQKELDDMRKPAVQEPELGAKPTLEDVDFDQDAYDQKLIEWTEAKRKSEKVKTESAKQAQAVQVEYAKAADKIAGYKQHEAVVVAELNDTQQGLLLQAMGKDAPKLVAALAKNADRLDELASITNPVQFVMKIAELKEKVTVSRTNPDKPKPVERVRSDATASGGADKTLERLRVQAQKTGDYTAYHAAKRKKGA